MLQNKIYRNYITEIIRSFLTILFGLSIIAWTVRAVNFLDLIVESGYPILTYFQYSFLNLFGILTKFIPLSFLLALTIFIIRQIQENELIILWTSGVKKIQIVNLFFLLSILISIFYLLFSNLVTPYALNKSRMLLGKDNVSSFLPTIRVQQFSDSFNNLTFIVDNKFENEIKNIFLYDGSNVLNSVSSSNVNKTSTTITAKSGIIENTVMVLFNGQIISSNKKNENNELIKFEQLNINLDNLENQIIKKPKIQESSTVKLIACANNNYLNDFDCKGSFKNEIAPVLNRRITLTMYIPVITLMASLLLIRSRSIFLNKIAVFGYCFLLLLYAELFIRYTGINELIAGIFILSPIIIASITYFLLKSKFSKESLLDE